MMARWYNKKDGLIHIGPLAEEEDDIVFTLCSGDGRLLALWRMDRMEDVATAPTCLQCIGWRANDAR